MMMRFEPFAELDRVTQEVFNQRTPAVPVDAYRLGERFFLHLDIPGIDPGSIEVTIERNTLTVSATRTIGDPDGGQWVARERPYGTFVRRFHLGEGLAADQIDAGYADGVLTISIPVAEQAKPRKINVEVGENASNKALVS